MIQIHCRGVGNSGAIEDFRTAERQRPTAALKLVGAQGMGGRRSNRNCTWRGGCHLGHIHGLGQLGELLQQGEPLHRAGQRQHGHMLWR